jgi:hypothetical protein
MAVYDPHLKLPYTIEWNVSLEQRLGTAQTLTASYVGAAGRRLLRETYYSNPSPSFKTLFVINNSSASDYNAMELAYRSRMSHGLNALASYTWSHSIDTASSDAFLLSATPGRASSDFDIRHAASVGLTYDIPPPQENKAARAILGGWSLYQTFVARTAVPISVIARTAFLGTQYVNVAPNLVPGAPLFLDDPNVAGSKRINPDAFRSPPASDENGTAPRNLLRGFGAYQFDFGLQRIFAVGEHLRLHVRAEAFNVLNHPEFANPVSSLSSPVFGISQSVLGRSLGSGGANGGFTPLYQFGGPRSIQLAVRLAF